MEIIWLYCFIPITKYFMLELLSELESIINSLPIKFDSEKFINTYSDEGIIYISPKLGLFGSYA